MKIAVLLPIWKRHDLAKICVNSLLEYKKSYDLEIICVGSEGDDSRKLAEGCHYLEVDNFPVSNKHNAGLLKAKDLNVDGVVLLGSDDLFNENLVKHWFSLDKNSLNVIGFKDIYFYCTSQKQLFYWKGYTNRTQTIGAGRFFSRAILDKVEWKLWADGLNRSLDTNCTGILKGKGIGENIIELKDIDGFLVDIKHSENITSLNAMKFVLNKTNEKMAKRLKKQDAEMVNNLPSPKKEKQKEVETLNILIDDNQKYKFVSNGKSKNLKKESEQYGFMVKILLKKELGHVENIND